MNATSYARRTVRHQRCLREQLVRMATGSSFVIVSRYPDVDAYQARD